MWVSGGSRCVTISNISRLNEYATCAEKYHQRYVLDRDTDKPEADFGTAIHAGLRAYYQQLGIVSFNPTYEKRPSAIVLLNRKHVIQVTLDALTGYVAPDKKQHENPGLAERMIEAYMDFYDDDRPLEVLAVEEPFEIDVAGHTILGRWDTVIRLPIGGDRGTLWHLQHKTVGMTVGIDSYVRKYDLAWHERAYLLGMRQKWPDEAVSGTIVNILRKSKRIVPANDFGRHFVPISSHLVDRFKVEAPARLGQIAQSEASGIWQQNPENCLSFGRLCPFHDSCLHGNDIDDERFTLRKADYVDEARAKHISKGR